MLDAAGHDDEFARPQLDNSVPEFDAKAPSPNQKHLFHVIVAVPRECPLHLDQLYLLAVQLGHDLGLPLLREAGKLFGDVDAFHLCYAGLMARSFSAVSPSIAARSASLNPGVPRM
jgi:hypothetical protein